jgi:hypothetical protein
MLESAASSSEVSALVFGPVQKRINHRPGFPTYSNSTNDQTCEMKLNSRREEKFASSFFRASFTTCAFSSSTQCPHSTPHLAKPTATMAAPQVWAGGQVLPPAYIPFPTPHASRSGDPRKAGLEGSNIECAEQPGEWICPTRSYGFSAHAVHATSYNIRESLYSQLINDRVVSASSGALHKWLAVGG